MMAFFIKMSTSGFIKMFVPNIALMFSKPIFQSSICFTNILDVTLSTADEIDDIAAITVHFLGDLMMVV